MNERITQILIYCIYKKQIQKTNRIKSKKRVQDTKSYYIHVRTYLTIIGSTIFANILKYPY